MQYIKALKARKVSMQLTRTEGIIWALNSNVFTNKKYFLCLRGKNKIKSPY